MRARNLLIIAELALLSLPTAGAGQSHGTQPIYDLVLSGGTVIDPETGLNEKRNVALSGGRIAEISKSRIYAVRNVDVRGLIVSPGFIDLHAHGQDNTAQALQVLDGVTSAIDMEAGAFPIADFYARRAGKMIINFGAAAGYRCVRKFVQIQSPCQDWLVSKTPPLPADDLSSRVPLTGDQGAKIGQILNSEIDKGAIGIGIGIDYIPGAGRAEVFDLFKLAGQRHVPVHVHVRRRATDFAEGIGVGVAQEVIADAVLTGAPLQIVHISSTAAPADVPVLLEIMSRASAKGFDITTEAYPYTASSTSIGSAIFDDGWQKRTGMKFGDLGWARTGERLTESTFAKYRRDEPGGSVIMHSIPEEVVRAAMAHPSVSIASDGAWWTTGGEHPRGAGTFARVLGHYVREQAVLDLPTAIKKMTLMPARRLEVSAPMMRAKGRIQVGADADITVFDPATIIDHATFERPMQASTGVRYVFVHGTMVVESGKLVAGAFPGRGIIGRQSSGRAQ